MTIIRSEVVRALELAEHRPSVFVETGTWDGTRSRDVASLFDSVYTIELSSEMFYIASKRLASIGNVTQFLGDSATIVPVLSQLIQQPVFWFFDAHWMETDPKHPHHGLVAAQNPYPLWSELKGIRNRVGQYADIVVVDDIHAFERANTGWEDVTRESIVRALDGGQHFDMSDAFMILPGKGNVRA